MQSYNVFNPKKIQTLRVYDLYINIGSCKTRSLRTAERVYDLYYIYRFLCGSSRLNYSVIVTVIVVTIITVNTVFVNGFSGRRVVLVELVASVKELGQRHRRRLAHGRGRRVGGGGAVARHYRHSREPGSALALAHLPAPAPPSAFSAVRHHPLAGFARALQVQLRARQVRPGDHAAPMTTRILRRHHRRPLDWTGRVTAVVL